MIDFTSWKKTWALLDKRERRNAWIVLTIVALSGLSSAFMVGSVLPFLTVLAEPATIQSTPLLAWAYATFGFSSDYNFLVGLGVVTLLVICLTSALQMLRSWAVARFSMMRMHTISQKLLASYLRQPYEFFLNRHSSEMGTRILSETQQFVQQFLRPAAEVVAATFTILAVVLLLLWIEPLIASLSLLLLGSVYALAYGLSRRTLRRLGTVRVGANSVRYRIANESLSGIKDIKLLGKEDAYVERYGTQSFKLAKAVTSIQIVSMIPRLCLEAIAYAGIVLLCLVLLDPQNLASGAAIAGILPTLGVFAFAGQRMMPELSKLYEALAQLQAGTAALNTVHDDLILRSNNQRAEQRPFSKAGLRRQLLIDDVSYHYPGASHAGIFDVSLDIAAGERVGIVGGTGAGKSTLADVILGLLAPQSGRLIVDGEAVEDATLRSWQQRVGYVPQDIFLTDASIAENVALGVPTDKINFARVERATRIAQLGDVVEMELPDGYATLVGERGVRLSGGQRQRIGIARALYHDADLILFDEATSALDNLTEREVMAAIDALPNEKTVIMIAHRLSTVRHCDRIVVMEHGRVVACANWETLMANSSEFRKIASMKDEIK